MNGIYFECTGLVLFDTGVYLIPGSIWYGGLFDIGIYLIRWFIDIGIYLIRWFIWYGALFDPGIYLIWGPFWSWDLFYLEIYLIRGSIWSGGLFDPGIYLIRGSIWSWDLFEILFYCEKSHFIERVISAGVNPILYMALNCQDAFWLKYL